MAVDKDLFLYDLAIVAIMKNEAPYAKEWIEYHLLAGANHFYIYDNESTDNLKEVLQPFINAGIVTYKFYPGKARQYEAYNEALQEYKFLCRYMAFIDADEFIFPKNNKSIAEVVDEILEKIPNAGGLAINWMVYGSNFQEKADYSRGVLERFTRRANTNYAPPMPHLQNLPGGNAHIKTLTNPRKVHHFGSLHYADYFEGCYAVNSNGVRVPIFVSSPPLDDKIVINHYVTKSKEEYFLKVNRGAADNKDNIYKHADLIKWDCNDVLDDGILIYRSIRYQVVEGVVRGTDYPKVYDALLSNLSQTLQKNTPQDFYTGKLETFLICRKLAEKLRESILDEKTGKFFEETALNAIYKTLLTPITMIDVRLLMAELPKILVLDYPAVKDIRKQFEIIISHAMDTYRSPYIEGWKEFVNFKYILDLIQIFDKYEQK